MICAGKDGVEVRQARVSIVFGMGFFIGGPSHAESLLAFASEAMAGQQSSPHLLCFALRLFFVPLPAIRPIRRRA